MAKTAEPNTTPAPDGRPLVARTSPLEDRWGRLSIVFGRNGVELLAGKKVLLFGLGGVGSNCLEPLARGGIGSFVLHNIAIDQHKRSDTAARLTSRARWCARLTPRPMWKRSTSSS